MVGLLLAACRSRCEILGLGKQGWKLAVIDTSVTCVVYELKSEKLSVGLQFDLY